MSASAAAGAVGDVRQVKEQDGSNTTYNPIPSEEDNRIRPTAAAVGTALTTETFEQTAKRVHYRESHLSCKQTSIAFLPFAITMLVVTYVGYIKAKTAELNDDTPITPTAITIFTANGLFNALISGFGGPQAFSGIANFFQNLNFKRRPLCQRFLIGFGIYAFANFAIAGGCMTAGAVAAADERIIGYHAKIPLLLLAMISDTVQIAYALMMLPKALKKTFSLVFKQPTQREKILNYLEDAIENVNNKAKAKSHSGFVSATAKSHLLGSDSNDTSYHRLLRHIEQEDIRNAAPVDKFRRRFVTPENFKIKAQRRSCCSLANVTRMGLYAFYGGTVLPFLLVTGGSEERGAKFFLEILGPVAKPTWFILPLIHIFTWGNSFATAFAALGMGALFWQLPAASAFTLIDKLLFAFLKTVSHIVKNFNSLDLSTIKNNYPLIFGFMTLAAIVAAVVPTQVSAQDIMEEGIDEIIADGGMAANTLKFFQQIGINATTLVYAGATPINASGGIGLFVAALAMAKLGSSHLYMKAFRCCARKYTNRQLAHYYDHKANTAMLDRLSDTQIAALLEDENNFRGVAPLPTGNDAAIQEYQTAATWFAKSALEDEKQMLRDSPYESSQSA